MVLIETRTKQGALLLVNPGMVQAFNIHTGYLYLNGAGTIIEEELRSEFAKALRNSVLESDLIDTTQV